MKQIYEAQI
jgi:hypothetical protein